MASYKSLDGSASSPDTRARLANLYAVVKSRCLRVPRLASQLLIAAALLLTLVCLVPSQTKQSFLGADFSNYWKWPYSSTAPSSPIYNISSGGPVRMVVFGTPDVASPSKSKGKSGPSWTEALCAELRCSSHESFVPALDLPTQVLTSNSLYKPTLQKLLVPVADQTNLGVDYRHVGKQYPLASTADIAHQVSQFLKGPKQTDPPKETIWVFSFGTWDIWTLAALPREVSQGLVRNMVEHLFSQIELLYKASLSVDSPAYSDFWAYTNASLLESLNSNPSADTIESFRIVIPELFDLSLTPGWHTQRPTPPVPHSKAEHMRPTDAQGKPYFGFWSPTGKAPGKGGASDNTLLVPYPRRAGLLTNTTSFVKEVIIESQLRASRLGDGLGRGKREDKALIRFDEVWTPCIWDGAASNPCKHSDKHLFYSPFTLGERAIREAARQTAEAVAMRLFAKEGEYDTAASGWRVEGTAKMRRAAMDPVSAICVASAVLNFVDFSIKIVRGSIQICGDANRDNDWQTPGDVAKKMTMLARNLRQPSGFGATPDEGEIAELAATCMTMAERLAALFQSLQPKDARSKRQCLWAAAKAKLKQADV
ncbi:uncharacterized protein VDAG_03843 [Verticillium dahliae VdLs.17]|uniref:Uncharacterized protein n=2 Tax=Verticillium dahliae TaxID=27337 RepID=G2X0R4_VERDV|nr:uncharacterized protein VDAG_03843 [Verticillium dahliae VdLs.17]EGY22405.1 hypothetical protein VDAG_03843 [Verticillium dahliae VdLs.17]